MTIKIDESKKEIIDGGRAISVPRREFQIISMLARAGGKVVSRDLIRREVWGENAVFNNRLIDQHVARLRRRLRSPAIRTLYHMGYAADGVEFVNEQKGYAAIRSIDHKNCTAVITVDFDTLPTLKIGGAVRVS